MGLKVTFSDRDEILGAMVRALAVQAGGFHMVGGMGGDYLRKNGFYRFPLSAEQSNRFRTLIKNYLADAFQSLLLITDE
jgi:hypothetical protein